MGVIKTTEHVTRDSDYRGEQGPFQFQFVEESRGLVVEVLWRQFCGRFFVLLGEGIAVSPATDKWRIGRGREASNC